MSNEADLRVTRTHQNGGRLQYRRLHHRSARTAAALDRLSRTQAA